MIFSHTIFQIIISLENWQEKIKLRWLWNSVYFVDKIASLNKMPKSEKGDNSAKYLQNFAKS